MIILKKRAVWGASLDCFCSFCAYYFELTWLPLFLVKAHGFSSKQMAQIGAGVYAIHAASSIEVGWLSDRSLTAGASPNRVRKALLVTGLVGIAVPMMMCAIAGPRLAIALSVTTAALFGTQTPTICAIAQTLGGPRAAGQWMGVQNLLGNLAGVIAPLVTGVLLDRSGEYFWAFTLAAAVALLGCLAFGVLIPTIEPILWPERPLKPALVPR
jgi:sugar phosphate permease